MSNFSNHVPEEVLHNPPSKRFLDVLDEVNNRKQEEFHPYLRSWNPALITDKSWVLKQLADYGMTDIPMELPLEMLRQVLLNIDTICGTRGSKIGLQLFMSIFSLGEVAIDDSGIAVGGEVLMLDHPIQGYAVGNTTQGKFYLVSNTTELNRTSTITATINSKFFNGGYPSIAEAIKSFLSPKNLKNQLPFSANLDLEIVYLPRDEFYFHRLLNKFFINE